MTRTKKSALSWILAVQGLERAAWNGMAPQLASLGVSLGASEGVTLFCLSLFTLLTYVTAYPLGGVVDRWLHPQYWCGIGLGIAAVGYALIARRTILPAAALFPVGLSLFRLGIGQLVAGLSGESESAWWKIHLVVNLASAVSGAGAQLLLWHSGLWALCAACVGIAVVAGLMCPLISSHRPSSRSKQEPSDSVMADQRWWAIGRICLLTSAAWLAGVQPLSTMTLFVTHTASSLGPVPLGAGSYASLHALLCAAVIVVSLRMRPSQSSIRKSVWAILGTATAFALLAVAGSLPKPASPLWLVVSYLFLAAAEPYLFVIGASVVGQLAPAGYSGRAFGVWYGSIGLTLFLGSVFGLMWDSLGPAAYFFLLALVLAGIAGLMARVSDRLDEILRRFA